MPYLEKRLSFFIPFYNEVASLKDSVEIVLQTARMNLTEFEILLINDGSDDGSVSVAEKLSQQESSIRIISFEKNQGFGSAYISGLLNARFNHAMYLTADGDVDSNELKQILEMWDGKSPLLQYSNNLRSRTLFRFFLSKLFTFTVNFLSGAHWPYYNGFNIYSLKNKNKLELKNFGFATQAYALLTLFESPHETLFLSTNSRFNDATSKGITLKNIHKAFLFFYYIVRNRI